MIASTAPASTRAASPTRGAFHRQVLPCRFRGESPPPFPQLCRCGPASDACSLLALLSHGGARPSTVVTGYSPVVVRTARRLPTSAIETKCDHNRTIDRAPHTAPKSPSAQLYLRVANTPFGAQPAEISRLRGRLVNKHGVFPPRSLTAEASPQPDWLGHLLSQP